MISGITFTIDLPYKIDIRITVKKFSCFLFTILAKLDGNTLAEKKLTIFIPVKKFYL